MADYLYSPYEQYIWKQLHSYFGGNDFAVAGAMGWMYGESFLNPYTVEMDSPSADNLAASYAITARFDKLGINETGQFSGNYNGVWLSRSVLDPYWTYNGKIYGGWNKYGYPNRGYPARAGYGLCQWTEASGVNDRKTRMMNYWKTLFRAGYRISIGSAQFQCLYFKYEMTNFYYSVYSNMIKSTTVREGMTAFGYFEAGYMPDLINQIVNQRVQWGINLYNKYSGATPVDPDDPKPPVPPDPDPEPEPDPSEPDTHRTPLWMMIDYYR